MSPAGPTKYRVSVLPKSISIIIGLCVVLAAGCGRGAKPAEERAPPATVKWEGPLQGALEEWTESAGTTVPLLDHVARVTAPVEGRVVSVLSQGGSHPVTEGQRVAAGTVLVQLDDTLIRANVT